MYVNPNITWDIVQAHPKMNWHWHALSRYNPNITWEIVRDHPDMPWDWNGLSYSSKITWDIVQAYSEKQWNWDGIITHSLIFIPTPLEIETFYRRVFAVRKIWRAWFRANTNPVYALCRQRLMKEYHELCA